MLNRVLLLWHVGPSSTRLTLPPCLHSIWHSLRRENTTPSSIITVSICTDPPFLSSMLSFYLSHRPVLYFHLHLSTLNLLWWRVRSTVRFLATLEELYFHQPVTSVIDCTSANILRAYFLLEVVHANCHGRSMGVRTISYPPHCMHNLSYHIISYQIPLIWNSQLSSSWIFFCICVNVLYLYWLELNGR